MIKAHKLNPEVYITDEVVPVVGLEEISFLKQAAQKNPRQRARLCAHKSDDEKLQDMMIVVTDNVYIRPHRHLAKAESFHIVEGQVDVLLFDENGNLTNVIEMGDAASGKPFFYRIDTPIFHSLAVRTPFLVFHEATQGPFDRAQSVQAPWAPDDAMTRDIIEYRKVLTLKIKDLKRHEK